MPGFLETSIHRGYGFLDPYVAKARTSVPLVDRVAKQAEVYVPPLITKVDTFAEPGIVKMRPYVEPRIEQVKEAMTPRIEQVKVVMTPYVDQGVKQYENVRDEGVKYYTVAQDKVDQAKVYQKDKVEQIKEYKDSKVKKLHNILCKKGGEINMIFRVPATEDVEGLKYKTYLGKVDTILKQAENLVDKFLPEPPSTEQTEDAAGEPVDDSYLLPRMLLLPMIIQTRLVYLCMAKGKGVAACAKQFKVRSTGSARNQITKIRTMVNDKTQPIVDQATGMLKSVKAQLIQRVKPRIVALKKTFVCKQARLVKFLVPKVGAVKGNKMVKKAVAVTQKTVTDSVETCEKALGKKKGTVMSKSKTLFLKVDRYLPASVKEVLAAPATKTATKTD